MASYMTPSFPTTMSPAAADLVTLLHQRGSVLMQLVTAPTDPATLTTEVSVSRTTVDRILAECEEWGLVDPDADRLEPTLFARLVLTVYDDFREDTMTMAAQEQETGDAPLWLTASERSDVLALVADRLAFLEVAQTPRDKRTLVGELPYARSTVDWAVRELEGISLIQRTASGYTTTPLGQQIAGRYRTLLTTLADLLAVQDLLAYLPADCPLPPSLFVDATIERAAESTPYRLFAGVRDRLDTADQVRILLPAPPTPQLLDMCHHRVVRHGTTLELVTNPAVAETLRTDFPGPLTEMAAAAVGNITAYVTDTPPFGVLLTSSAANPGISILVYDQQAVYGAIHPETDVADTWVEDYYERIRDNATETTTDLQKVAATASLAGVPDPARVEREAEGFVQLTPEYFTERTPAPPATAWRAGFDLVDVHAGYAIDRQTECDSDGTGQSLTDFLITRLDAGGDHALVGPPGSGKSTVCQAVACQWYEQGRGAVFYRESGTGTTFDAPAILNAQLRAADGQTLVVVEDAVRAEANTVFRVMENFRDDATVTFLLDARTYEWDDPPAFPTDARLDAYRTDTVEMVTMPGLDEHVCERLVEHFQETTGHRVDIPVAHLLQSSETETDDTTELEGVQASQPAEFLLALHRLTLSADPLSGEESRTPTTLTEDVQRTYAALRSESDLALDVGVLVNLLNVAGLGVQPALVYSLADDDDEVETVRAALATLNGQIIFTREGSIRATAYRTVHETWSELFLDHLLVAAESDRAASERFGRCVSALFALADDATQRERSTAAVGGNAPIIDRIAATPRKWADTTIERVFQPGQNRAKIAPLFGMTEYPTIELPTACSPTMVPRCARWRGDTYLTGGHLDRAHRELTRAIDLIDASETSVTAVLREVKASSYRKLGFLAFERGDLASATEYYTHGRDSYRTIDDRIGEADCDKGLGSVVSVQGDYEWAVEYLKQSLATYRAFGASRNKRVLVLNNLGLIAMRRGALDRAADYLDQSIEIGHDSERHWSLAQAYGKRGTVARVRNNLDHAEDCYRRHLAIARETGIAVLTAAGLLGRGWVALDRDDLDRAAEYIQHGLDIGHKTESLRTNALGYRLLGTLARKDGALRTAEAHLTDALELTRDGGNRYREAQTLAELGKLAMARDDREQAREQFTAAIAIYRELGAIRDAVTSLELTAKICKKLNDHDAALTHYETAITMVDEAAFDVPTESISEQRAILTADASDNGKTNDGR
jgi:tetratricopeptide (TPR) repeat protein/predicted transcriptional regulator